MIPDQPLVDPPEERLDTALFLAVPGIGGTVAGHYYHARRELHKGPFHGHLMRVTVGHTQQLTEGQPAVEVINDDYFLVVVAVPPLPLHFIEFSSGVFSCPTALPATRRARDDDDFRFEVILLKNSSHPEDLAAALPIVSRITPDGYGVQAQVLKQLILFTMMKKTMNGTCSKLKIEIIPKTHRVVRLEIIQQ